MNNFERGIKNPQRNLFPGSKQNLFDFSFCGIVVFIAKQEQHENRAGTLLQIPTLGANFFREFSRLGLIMNIHKKL